MLGARRSLIDAQARGRAHEGRLADLDPVTASVLYDILRGPHERRRWTHFTTLDEHDAIRHLLTAELIDENRDTLRPTDRAIDLFGIVTYDDTYWRYPQIDLHETIALLTDLGPAPMERQIH